MGDKNIDNIDLFTRRITGGNVASGSVVCQSEPGFIHAKCCNRFQTLTERPKSLNCKDVITGLRTSKRMQRIAISRRSRNRTRLLLQRRPISRFEKRKLRVHSPKLKEACRGFKIYVSDIREKFETIVSMAGSGLSAGLIGSALVRGRSKNETLPQPSSIPGRPHFIIAFFPLNRNLLTG